MSDDTRRAVGAVETNSIPRGILVTDEMVKRADVTVVDSCPLCPGKYLSIVQGHVDEVRSAVERGVQAAAAFLVDFVVIPDLHPSVLPAVARTTPVGLVAALGVIETHAMATALEVADTVAKAAATELIEVRLSRCLGGKSFVSFTGDIGSVRAAAADGERLARSRGQLVHAVVIARPHAQLHRFLV